MTEKEAMEIIMQVAYDGEFPNNSNEAFGIACKCIEKQIPKKPNKAIDKSWGIKKEAYVCPICDYFLPTIHFIEIGEGKRIKTSYCETCGQKIDWEEVEE